LAWFVDEVFDALSGWWDEERQAQNMEADGYFLS
jgi:hypothetical protein